MENKLDNLLMLIQQAEFEFGKAKKPNTLSFWKGQLKALKQRFTTFGQRYNLVMVEFYGRMEPTGTLLGYKILYCDVSDSDAISYTKMKLETMGVEFKDLKAQELIPGKPIKKVL